MCILNLKHRDTYVCFFERTQECFMATAIVPKSEARRSNSIICGFGEVPSVLTKTGQIGWGLPGDTITFCEKEAQRAAQCLDTTIRTLMVTTTKSLI